MRKATSNVIKFVPHLLIKRAQERNLIAAKRVEAGLPAIGIFWAVPNQKGQPEILSYVVDISLAGDYGGNKTSDESHYRLWTTLQRACPADGKTSGPSITSIGRGGVSTTMSTMTNFC